MIDFKGLGRRAKAAPGYREASCMLSLPDEHGRTFRLLAPKKWTQESGPTLRCSPDVAALLPDLSDHTTLWALVGVAFDGTVIHGSVTLMPSGWANLSNRSGAFGGPCLAEVVVFALERA